MAIDALIDDATTRLREVMAEHRRGQTFALRISSQEIPWTHTIIPQGAA